MTTKTKEAEGNGSITTAKARELLLTEQRRRVETCKAELQQLLDRHRCRLDPYTVIRGGQIMTQLEIVPTE